MGTVDLATATAAADASPQGVAQGATDGFPPALAALYTASVMARLAQPLDLDAADAAEVAFEAAYEDWRAAQDAEKAALAAFATAALQRKRARAEAAADAAADAAHDPAYEAAYEAWCLAFDAARKGGAA